MIKVGQVYTYNADITVKCIITKLIDDDRMEYTFIDNYPKWGLAKGLKRERTVSNFTIYYTLKPPRPNVKPEWL